MNRNALSFIEASEKLFGANAIVTRDNINEIVKESGAPYPYWLVTKTEYRYGRGQYKVPSSGNKVEQIEQKEEEMEVAYHNVVALRQPKLVDDNEPSVPSKYPNYVPFGFFKDMQIGRAHV